MHYVYEKIVGAYCKRKLAYNNCIYQTEAGRRMDGGAIWMETKDLKWNNLLAKQETAPSPLSHPSHQTQSLVMVLAVEVFTHTHTQKTFTYGLSLNLQWYPETHANYYMEFSTVLELIPNSFA